MKDSKAQNLLSLPEEIFFALCVIGGVLITASLIVFILTKLKPQNDFNSLAQRVKSWWVMAVVFTLAILMSEKVSIVFFGLVSFLALKEFFSLIPTRRADRRALFWGYLAIPLQYYWIHQEWYGLFIIFIPVYMFLFIPLRMVLIGQTDGYIKSVGTIHWGLMLTVFCLSHTAFLLILKRNDFPGELPGIGLVLFLVIMTQLNDVFQFIWGKLFGRAKILPSVSPGKTWAGFIGGVLTCIIIAWVLGPFLTILDPKQSLISGFIIGVSGFFGDVNLSALKRDMNIKDSGSLLPGHGGILDRVDSLTYTSPLFFHFVYWSFDFHTFGATL
jgi:phosphatidate cytidylyltransferase